MSRIRLEIDKIQIHRPKERWKLYFVVVCEHPDDPEKMILTTFPQQPIKLSPRHNNEYSFDTNEAGSEGLFVLSRNLPANKELNVHIYLRHTRDDLRNLGDVLKNIESGISGDAFGIVSDLVGTTVPWLVIAKKAVPLIGNILANIKDRDFGFVSAFERFGPEFIQQGEIDRKKDFSGDATVVYSWALED
jgi:hypothetical protein